VGALVGSPHRCAPETFLRNRAHALKSRSPRPFSGPGQG
jgi:hypothetical protein